MNGLPSLAEILKFRMPKRQSTAIHTGLRIRVYCDVTMQPLDRVLNYFCFKNELEINLEIGGYDQFLFETQKQFGDHSPTPDLIYIHSSCLKYFVLDPGLCGGAFESSNETLLDRFVSKVRDMIKGSESLILVNLFEYPPYRLRGTHARQFGNIKKIEEVNSALISLSKNSKNLILHDLNYLSAYIGLTSWYDFESWTSFKQPFSNRALVEIGASLASVLASNYGKSKKIIFSDLDNTLWGGVIGDDGVDNIALGNGTAAGEKYSLVQKYLDRLQRSGILVACISKNDIENVLEVFNSDKPSFSFEKFCITKINWDPKSQNIIKALLELNLGAHSAVFIDDNTIEIEEVKKNIANIFCVQHTNSPLEILETIERWGCFETQTLHAEDLMRNDFYSRKNYLDKQINNHSNYDEFLVSLNMKGTISWNPKENLSRISSLTRKTNQFNISQIQLSENQAKEIGLNPKKFIISVGLSDRTGDHGTVSVLFGDISQHELSIINWVMSCRVFGRGLEEFILSHVILKAKQLGLSKVSAKVLWSERNRYCRSVFDLEKITKKIISDGEFHYTINLKNVNMKKGYGLNGKKLSIEINK